MSQPFQVDIWSTTGKHEQQPGSVGFTWLRLLACTHLTVGILSFICGILCSRRCRRKAKATPPRPSRNLDLDPQPLQPLRI